MDETWFSKIEGMVVTQLSYMLKERDNAPYPDMKITSVNQSPTPATFPTMYVHEEQMERGQDLYNASVNAVISTVDLNIWTNRGQSVCKEMVAAAIVEMKRLGYDIVSDQGIVTGGDVSHGILRTRRIIGANDKF